MNRNQIIGFLLIGAILVGYVFLTKPTKKEIEEQRRLDSIAQLNNQNQKPPLPDSIKNLDTNLIAITDTTSDSVALNLLSNKFGVFANSGRGEQNFYTIENDKIKVKISNKGAKIYSVLLKEYLTHSKAPLYLFSGDSNRFSINFFAVDKLIQTENLYFEPVKNDTLIDASKKENSLVLRAKVADDKYLEFSYKLTPGSYQVDFDINFVNLHSVVPMSTTFLEIYWDEYVKNIERGDKWERQNTQLFYKLYEEKVTSLKNRKDSTSQDVSSKISWISYKQQYFNTTLISKNYFDYVTLKAKQFKDDTVNSFFMSSRITVPFKVSEKASVNLSYFFGPNKYSVLRKIKIGDKKAEMEKLIPLGGSILGWVNKILILPVFNYLEKYIASFGIIILILTLFIKILLFPLTHKTYQSSAKMKILKPEVDKVLEKIPQDKQMERQQATMNLYKKAGVNPLGGCIPTLLQFPILFALYRFFPASIELRQKSFLWVDDLSTYDAILTWTGNIPVVNWIFGNHISLFTLLMAASMLFNTWLTNSTGTMDSSNPQAKTMKFMMYMMPFMMIVWFNGYSAALSYYFFVSTMIGSLQILISRKMINEQKVLAKLQDNIKNNKVEKKSKFMQRYEEMQKQQNALRNKRN